MSSSVNACWDDENDWNDLKKAANIQSVDWGVYSRRAFYAKQGYAKGHLGDRLILYVNQAMDLEEFQSAQQKEIEEFEFYLKLKEKFGQ